MESNKLSKYTNMDKDQNTSQNTDSTIVVDPVLVPLFIDCNGDEIKEGDRIHLTIQGVGDGFVEIVKHDEQLCLYERTQGYYPLIHAVNRTDMILEIEHKLDEPR